MPHRHRPKTEQSFERKKLIQNQNSLRILAVFTKLKLEA
jgi:hypothetical protein